MLPNRLQRFVRRGRSPLASVALASAATLALVGAATFGAPTAHADGPPANGPPANGPATLNRFESELDGLAGRIVPSVVAIQRQGAGVVISEDGLVLTSTSVVPQAGRRVRLTLVGGRRVEAREVARDAANGAVVLRIQDVEGLHLTAATMGLSGALAPGSMVATFGNPYGTHATDGQPAMSLGVVSGLYPMPGDKRGGLAIETDAAVNPGSFGGPLVNRHGQLIGIVVPAYRNDRYLGLARPIDSLKGLIDAAKAGVPYVTAKVQARRATPNADRGLLGIFIYKDDDSPNGARIEKVQPKSASAAAGIRPGDVVRRFNGKKVRSSKQLARFLAKVKGGDKVKLRVERNKWFRDFTVTARGAGLAQGGKPYLGVFLDVTDSGLVVDRAEAGGPAAKAGIKAGDVLGDFADVAALQKYLKSKKPGQKIELRVIREGWSKTVGVTLGGRPGSPQAQAPTPRESTPHEHTPRTAPKKKGYLGAYLEDGDGGVGIADVVDGSPADEAGLKSGDVILSVQGKRTANLKAFGPAMSSFGAGDTVHLDIRRGDRTKTVGLTLGARPGSAPAPRAQAPAKKKGYLGIYLGEAIDGVAVNDLIAGSPAEKAGLQAGDVITRIGETRVDSIESLSSAMSAYGVGDTVSVELRREGGVAIKSIVLGERPGEGAMRAPRAEAPAPAPKKKGFLGVYLEATDHGIKVTDVVAGSPAEYGGLLANDVIVEVAGNRTGSLDAFGAAMSGYGAGDTVTFSVTRDGKAETVRIELGERPGQVPAPRAEAPAPAPKKPGFLGISVTEEDHGLVISEIVASSPAAKSALAIGQTIVTVNGTAIKTIDDLGGVLKGKLAGDVIKIEVESKGGAKSVIDVTLEPRS